ncbi:MAG: bacteriohopanetetrol glucosamine biosynthesis glycosyltransferase HpnI [Acidobacteriota bacterium]|nr:bacteriohopanetetrol glucosamine biosynthesis glycosyltransferase HpnI [Acidobacteriota bacterium]
MSSAAAVVLLAVTVGSLVYCGLTLVAARRYLCVRPPAGAPQPPISVLKPLHGVDEGLEENLESYFTQDYPAFELLFAARDAGDPALAVVARLCARHPGVAARTFVTGEPPYPNAKVYSLDRMFAGARHDLLVMSDSDVRVSPDLLATVAAEFADPPLGLATCPYRAVPGPSIWSTLEAIGLNTEFLSGVLVARLLDGMKFALGPTIAARREVLVRIGGFDRLSRYLAEDFVMGQFAAEAGYGVILSSYVVEHRIGSQGFAANVRHRLRWNRSTRRSRPWGYVGQVFTNPLPPAVLMTLLRPGWWPVLALTVVLRGAAGWAAGIAVLHDPLVRRRWYLMPLQDGVSFLAWLGGFFGNTITWRGRTYSVKKDGTFERVDGGQGQGAR